MSDSSTVPEIKQIKSIEELQRYFNVVACKCVLFTWYKNKHLIPNISIAKLPYNPGEPTKEYVDEVLQRTMMIGHILDKLSKSYEKRPLHYDEMILKMWQSVNSIEGRHYPEWKKISDQLRGVVKHFERIVAARKPQSEGIIFDPKQSLSQQKQKTEILKFNLSNYGFFGLPLVQALPEENKNRLIEFIAHNKLPYQIAMLDYLGFISHLGKNYFKGNNELTKKLSGVLDSDKDGRGVRGEINSLCRSTGENTSRYKAHTYKETVTQDYNQLK